MYRLLTLEHGGRGFEFYSGHLCMNSICVRVILCRKCQISTISLSESHLFTVLYKKKNKNKKKNKKKEKEEEEKKKKKNCIVFWSGGQSYNAKTLHIICPTALNSADLLSNQEGDMRHFCVFQQEFHSNEPASDAVHGLHQDVLYCHTVRGLQGTNINVISFTPQQKARLSLRGFFPTLTNGRRHSLQTSGTECHAGWATNVGSGDREIPCPY